ncbi:hypothetical protein LCGC14_1008690 [marine sediment metagenome]|uniref:HD-GYP domain-containing protein n=1 Tax=marine sediment metagenome TaxID=412755 RepID=A0A0F9R708_9ZZZZ
MDVSLTTLLTAQPSSLNKYLRDIRSQLNQHSLPLSGIYCFLFDENSHEYHLFISNHDEQCDELNTRLLSFLNKSLLDTTFDHFSTQVLSEEIKLTLLSDAKNDLSGLFYAPLIIGNKLIGSVIIVCDDLNTLTVSESNHLSLFTQTLAKLINAERSLVNTLTATINSIRHFTDYRDTETGLHLDRVSRYSAIIARKLAAEIELDNEFIEHISLFSRLHDIGKIAIPDAILNKPGRHNDAEHEIMKTHVTRGLEILERVLQDYELHEMASVDIMRNIIGCHHEYLDGSGYPKGLREDEIPIEARIVTVADIFDALTCYRPYKKAWSVNKAIEELRLMAEQNKLDKHCVNALIAKQAEIEDIVEQWADDTSQ